jgi:alpha-L-fucosidase
VDVSIRPGWFHHPAEDAKVRSVDDLVELYFSSVGRNGKLLLNVPATRQGLFHPTDVERLAGFRQRLRAMFENDLTIGAVRAWRVDESAALLQLELPATRTVSMVRLEENIERGQSVHAYLIHAQGERGRWQLLNPMPTTIGYAKLDRFAPTPIKRLRILIDSLEDKPEPIVVRLFGPVLTS